LGCRPDLSTRLPSHALGTAEVPSDPQRASEVRTGAASHKVPSFANFDISVTHCQQTIKSYECHLRCQHFFQQVVKKCALKAPDNPPYQDKFLMATDVIFIE
jgi:hypothetical protein